MDPRPLEIQPPKESSILRIIISRMGEERQLHSSRKPDKSFLKKIHHEDRLSRTNQEGGNRVKRRFKITHLSLNSLL